MINSFTGPHRFLSNFYIEPDGTCVEVEYQMSKCVYSGDMDKFIGLFPGQAKRLGRKIKIRPDWNEIKLEVMRELVSKKFKDHPYLARMLVLTAGRTLTEGNTWGDTFWGVCGGKGENNLGKILMKVREEILTK
jgi:ribA/ribD-fused uncharacterized protein